MAMDVRLRNKNSGEEIVVLISHWNNVLKKQGNYEVVDDGRNPSEVIEELKTLDNVKEEPWPTWNAEAVRDTLKDNPHWYGLDEKVPEGALEELPEASSPKEAGKSVRFGKLTLKSKKKSGKSD